MLKNIIVFILVFSSMLYGETLEEIGNGESYRKAKGDALKALSERIQVEIKTSSKLNTIYKGNKVIKDEFEINNIINSDKNLYGVRYEKISDVSVKAIFDIKSLGEYERHIEIKRKNIIEAVKKINHRKSLESKEKYTQEVLEELKNYLVKEDLYLVLKNLLRAKTNYTTIDNEKVEIEVNGIKNKVYIDVVSLKELQFKFMKLTSVIILGVELDKSSEKYKFLEEYPNYLLGRIKSDFTLGDKDHSNIVIIFKNLNVTYIENGSSTLIDGKVEIYDKIKGDHIYRSTFRESSKGKGDIVEEMILLKILQYGRQGERIIKKLETILR